MEHTCSYDEETCQVLDEQGNPIVFDPSCKACLAEQASPRMLSALRAIRARINGEWDNPDLIAFGPLSNGITADILAMLQPAISEAEEGVS